MILHVVGARPNYMKADPLIRALDCEQVLVHTGQHYDPVMYSELFEDLGLRKPDVTLGGGSLGQMIDALEREISERKPSMVVVYGDVNSTLAGALASARCGVKLAHVEAGLRSWDWAMPEEQNRVLVDRLAHLLFTPSPDATKRLERERYPHQRVVEVGNLMIDTLMRVLPQTKAREGRYLLITMHRPENRAYLDKVIEAVEILGIEAVWPVHPSIKDDFSHPLIRFTGPMGYLDMVGHLRGAYCVITDSGGLQEETSALGVPCVTFRRSTERPLTVHEGTNILVTEKTPEAICEGVTKAIRKRGRIPEWDGKAAERVARCL